MPTQIRPLDSNSAYVYCEVCRNQGTPNSILHRDSVGKISCQFGHSPNPLVADHGTSGLAPMTADAIKAVDIQPEIPLITDVAWKIFVQPATKDKLERQLKGRVFATISTLLMALADGSLVMITGEDAAKLKKYGVKSGAEMLSYIESVKGLEKERDELALQVSKFMKMLQSAAQE
jgi:hypothetical protein